MAMIEMDQNLTKLYYSIGEVAQMFEVNTSLIRFWEKEFSIIKPSKNKKGNRLFTQKDIFNFRLIYKLVKIEGYTLDGAKQRLKKKEPVIIKTSQQNVVSVLENLKKELLTIQEGL